MSYVHGMINDGDVDFFNKQKLNGAKMTIKIEKNGAKLAKKY